MKAHALPREVLRRPSARRLSPPPQLQLGFTRFTRCPPLLLPAPRVARSTNSTCVAAMAGDDHGCVSEAANMWSSALSAASSDGLLARSVLRPTHTRGHESVARRSMQVLQRGRVVQHGFNLCPRHCVRICWCIHQQPHTGQFVTPYTYITIQRYI